MRRLLGAALPLLAGLLVALPARAAYITLHEAAMEADFAGAGIEIDLRFNGARTLARPELLAVESFEEYEALLESPPRSTHAVNLFFIDSLEYCSGERDPTYIGCARIGGNGFMVESAAAAVPQGYGALLKAHELGHNYGLSHHGDETNLMHPGPTGHPDRTLTPEQRSAIRSSPFTQSEGIGIGFGDLYTTINPIVVVPEPGSALLLAGGLGGLALAGRRCRRAG